LTGKSGDNRIAHSKIGESHTEGSSENFEISIEEFRSRLQKFKGETPGDRSHDQNSGKRPILIFDQFEEVVTLFEEGRDGKGERAMEAQREILDTIIDLINDEKLPIKILLVFREDWPLHFELWFAAESRAEAPSAPKPGETNASKTEGLRPEVAELAAELIRRAKDQGIDAKIIKGYVSDEEQAKLYAKGRTEPGPIVTNIKSGGKHNLGLAFDVAPVVNGKVVLQDVDTFKKLGAIGKSLGLVWGGDLPQLRDLPHFEYSPK
jgi:D-alanyl-D-alanine carboxypeptidase